MPRPENYFAQTRPNTPRVRERASDRAIYQVKNASGEAITIAVDCIEGGGNVPRDAANLRELTAKLDMERELAAIGAVADTVLSTLKALKPGAVEIEFGVELGGEMGIPLVTKGEAKANFKITLKWHDDEKGG